VPLHQSGATVGGPPKPKQPPQILPKPPSGQPSSGSHTKIAANSRSATSSQHQGTFHYSDILVQNEVRWHAFVKVIMNLWVP
jgi:hypothetical protein